MFGTDGCLRSTAGGRVIEIPCADRVLRIHSEISFADGIRSAKLVQATYRSAQEGRVVRGNEIEG